MSRQANKTTAAGSYFGVRARLALIITLLLAGVSGTQYAINYRQQQQVVAKLLELNRQINRTIQDIDRQIQKRSQRVVQDGLAPGEAGGAAQVERELKSFLEFVDSNFESLLTRPAPGWPEVAERISRLRRLASAGALDRGPGSDWSFFQVTVSVMDEMTRRGSRWRYQISSRPVLPAGDDILQVSIPIVEEGQVRFVNLQYQIGDFLEDFRAYRLTSLLVTLSVLGLGLVAALVFSGRFTRPIRQLNQAFKRVEQGDLECRVGVRRRDEIGQLVAGFNQMVGRLKQNKDLETNLHRQERLGSLGQMAAGIAHEIKNPLNAINLTLQHLGDKLTLNVPGERELYERYSQNIQRETARLGKIVDTFLSFARVSEMERRHTDLHQVIEDVLTLVAPDAEKRGIRIERAFAHGPLVRTVDQEKMKTVFMNLVLNAVQAMPSGGRLRVATGSDGDGPAVVAVSDTGTGIAPENLERVFDLYFSTKENGSGLGLALAGNIVRDHGGEISVSSSLGTGSEFTVTLP
ncbi:MAG: HAMP domain-containing protein [Candidatus Glassbacteria bacterium]|nr:HAMP domain-containing protein [Candidatus Glassbacteria bacterium]